VRARAALAQQARLKTPLSVGTLVSPAGATFFRTLANPASVEWAQVAWCTLADSAASAGKARLLCLLNGNDGYRAVLAPPSQATLVTTRPLDELVTTAVVLEPVPETAAADFPVDYKVMAKYPRETLEGEARWGEAVIPVETHLINASYGVDRVAKNRSPQPDIDARPVVVGIGGQAVEVSATGKGRGRLFQTRIGADVGPPTVVSEPREAGPKS
jgi:hypothetical protein